MTNLTCLDHSSLMALTVAIAKKQNYDKNSLVTALSNIFRDL